MLVVPRARRMAAVGLEEDMKSFFVGGRGSGEGRGSPEGMKRIIAATKKRWKLQKAAAKSQSTQTTKASKRVAVKVAKKTSPAKAKKSSTKKKALTAVPAVAQAGA